MTWSHDCICMHLWETERCTLCRIHSPGDKSCSTKPDVKVTKFVSPSQHRPCHQHVNFERVRALEVFVAVSDWMTRNVMYVFCLLDMAAVIQLAWILAIKIQLLQTELLCALLSSGKLSNDQICPCGVVVCDMMSCSLGNIFLNILNTKYCNLFWYVSGLFLFPFATFTTWVFCIFAHPYP